MPMITTDISRDFINAVKLVPPPGRARGARSPQDAPPVGLRDQDAQSLVVGSGLVVAAEQVPTQIRRDLVNCTLFAQLAAGGEVSDPADTARWYTVYFRTLAALGWAQSDTHFEEYRFAGKKAEAHDAILTVLTALLGPQAAALAVVRTAIEALQSMDENSHWMTLFERQSKTGQSARFQVATAQMGQGGLLQTALVGFDLKARSTLTQVLFLKFGSSATSLKYAAGVATIYEEALAAQRELIESRLAAYRTAYIGAVRLPPPPSGALRSARSAAPRTRGAGTGSPRPASASDIRRYLLG